MKIIFIIVLALLVPSLSFARWAEIGDFAFIAQKSQTEISIKEDGTYEEIKSYTFKIQKEDAKNTFSPFKIQYDSNTTTFSILEAYVENGTEKTAVDKASIQNSTITAKAMGLVSHNEISVPFSQIKVGSVIHIKSKSIVKPGVFGKYFSFTNNYGRQYFEMQNTISIKSSKELFFKITDPVKVLIVTNKKNKDGTHTIVVRLKDPYVNIIVQENGTIKPDTNLTVSSIDTWTKLREFVNAKLNSQLKDQLPTPLVEFLTTVPKDAPFEKKIDLILAYLSANYEYLGDWKKIGSLSTKKINDIVTDKFGDSKDLSIIFLKLLEQSGINAQLALVERIERGLVSEEMLPALDYFNHMIVRVEQNGKTYWLDPTNKFSAGVNYRKDLSFKNAFILGENQKLFEKIPLSEPLISNSTTSKTYVFSSASQATVISDINITGEIANLFLDANKNKSKLELQDTIFKTFTANENATLSKFDSFGKKSNRYYDLNFKIQYQASQLSQKTNDQNGNVIMLPEIHDAKTLGRFTKGDIGIADMRLTPVVRNKIIYKNIFLNGNFPEVCEIQNEWIMASRKIEQNAEGIILTDYLGLKKFLLISDDYKKDEFISSMQAAAKCFLSSPMQFKFGGKKAQ